MSILKPIEADRRLQRTIQSYYESWESYFGYKLALDGAQHYGYYEKDTYWPFPIYASLTRMQAQMLNVLALPPSSTILEAGCGSARVALYMANRGMRVIAIDNLDYHISQARQNVEESELPVAVKKMDYHHLEAIPTNSLDGVYTLQALGHAVDLEGALAGFHRVVRPGGRVAFIEVERLRDNEVVKSDDELTRHLKLVNELVGYPTNEASREDYFKDLILKAGFVDVEVQDYSENIRPMLRMCYMLMIFPFFIVKLLGLERYFVTMLAVTSGFLGRARWRFIAISAMKSAEKVWP